MIYAGSKRRLSEPLSKIINEFIVNYNIKNYYEPFVGGFNLFEKIKCENKIANDVNKYVIALVNQAINDDNFFNYIPERVSRKKYDDVKKNYEIQSIKYLDWFYGLILWGASFNGLFAKGYGAETQAAGDNFKFRNRYAERLRSFKKQIDILKLEKFHIVSDDYLKLKLPTDKSILIYCDPPYKNTGVRYGEKFNHDIFWDWVRQQSINGRIVLVSELSAPSDFICIFKKEIIKSINVTNDLQSEKLFILNKRLDPC